MINMSTTRCELPTDYDEQARLVGMTGRTEDNAVEGRRHEQDGNTNEQKQCL